MNTENQFVHIKKLGKDDFINIGCALEVHPCPFYGVKNIYRIEGHKDSETGMMDGFDTHFNIEQVRGYKGYSNWVIITKIDVGGFGGGEHSEQVFKGIINNKSELEFIIERLGITAANLPFV